MKDIKETKFISKATKKNLLIVVNVVLLVALLAISTYAWFFHNLVDEVNTDVIQFDGSSDLEVSLDGVSYGYSKTMESDTSSLSKEITGDGVVANFSRVVTKSDTTNTTVLVPDTAATWKPALVGDYIIQPVYFRSKEDMSVYLGKESFVKGDDELKGGSLYGDSVTNASTVSNIKNNSPSGSTIKVSKDCIVGATRFAFLNDTADTSNLVWIPRPDIFYQTTTTANVLYHSDSTITKTPHPYSNSGTHYYYNTSKQQKTFANTFAGTANLATTTSYTNSNKVVTLTKETAEAEYYTGRINVVIWVEGCDAEARRAFANGKFGAYMQFVGAKNLG